MATVKLQNVSKSYAKTQVIHNVNCNIDDGQFIVIVGPSGCGKSTLLRMIAGLEKISAGDIFIKERRVNDLEPAKRDIAMVFQNYALYPHMSVFDNMAYGLKIRGISKKDIAKRVEGVAAILKLDKKQLKRKPRQLSGGQRQRVAMGRAIVREPSVFLFDEPLSNLDAKLRVQMRLEIKKLQKKLKITSIYVTHDQVEAMTLGHRLLVMNAGIVEQMGTPMTLYEKPATIFVAGFIGSPAMNFLPLHVNDLGKVSLPSGDTLIFKDIDFSPQKNRSITLGIRPEHFTMADSDNTMFKLKTNLVEQLGADTLVHGQVGKDETHITVRLRGIRHIEIDEVLSLSVQIKHLHFFDANNGKRLNSIN